MNRLIIAATVAAIAILGNNAASLADPWKDESGKGHKHFEKAREHQEKWQEKQWEEAKKFREKEREHAQKRWEHQRKHEEKEREAHQRWREHDRDRFEDRGFGQERFYPPEPSYRYDRFDYRERRPPAYRHYDGSPHFAPPPLPPPDDFEGGYYRNDYGRYHNDYGYGPYGHYHGRAAETGASIGARIGGAIGGPQGAAIGADIGHDIGVEIDRD